MLIMSEIRKIINRKRFWVILILLLISVFMDFFITCASYYGKPLSEVPSAYDSMIIYNYIGTSAGLLFESFLFFLVAPIIASDIFYDEKEAGLQNYIFTRISRKRYVIYKALTLMTVVFCVIVFPLLLSQILALTAFPIQGHLTGKITYNELMSPDKNRVFSYFQNFYPYLNNLLFIILRGITGAVAALFSFSFTFINHTKKFILILAPMIFYILYFTAADMIESKLFNGIPGTFITTDILGVNSYGSIWPVILFHLILVILSILFIWKGLRSDEALL